VEVTDSADILHYDERSLRKAGVLGLAGVQVGHVAMLHVGAKIERFRFSRTEGSVFDEGLGTFRDGMRYLMVGLIIDDLDRHPFPRQGQRHFVRVGGASDVIGGTENFLKLDGSLGYYATLGNRHTLIPQTRLAWSSSPLPATEKTYLGGALAEEHYREMDVYNHVPFLGLRPRSLPGDVMAVLHLAYRLQLVERLFLNVAVDWGYAWPEEEFRWDGEFLSECISRAPLGVGAGVAYNTPVGPIRLSWGRLLRKLAPYNKIGGENLIYFSAGHNF
jgi:outer membrane translocation and assembly module TamA